MRKALLLSLTLPLVLSAQAKPIVVATLGKTVEASQYVPTMNKMGTFPTTSSPKSAVSKMFNVHSTLLTPGKVMLRKMKSATPFTPIYLVGTDKQSVQWVNQYSTRLKALHARGYLVNVKNHSDYQQFFDETGLRLETISGDGLAKTYGLTHYPVLISDKQIEQ